MHSVKDLEFNKSRMTSHCEIILGFCLSASHPVFRRVRLRRNGVRFPKRTHDSYRLLCVVRVQRSISEREASHPVFFY